MGDIVDSTINSSIFKIVRYIDTVSSEIYIMSGPPGASSNKKSHG